MSPAGYTDPSSATTSPAAPDSAISAGPSSGPARKAALARTSACQPCAATTVTPATPLTADRPVRGSMRWWRGSPSAPVHVRFVRQLDATAPAPRQRLPRTLSGSSGSAIATTQELVGRCLTRDPEIAADAHEHSARAARHQTPRRQGRPRIPCRSRRDRRWCAVRVARFRRRGRDGCRASGEPRMCVAVCTPRSSSPAEASGRSRSS